MALTGSLTYKGLTISNAHLRVMQAHHRVVDTSTEAEDGSVSWSKTLYADYAANPDEAIYTISGSFTPSVAEDAKDIVEQTYVHLKTLDTYKDLSDA